MAFHTQYSLKFALLLALVAQMTSYHVCAEAPDFIQGSIYSSNKAKVSTVESSLAVDLVILDGGLEQGFRLGMVCLIERGTQSIGELIIIQSNSNCSAALILDLADNSIIRSGDNVRIKTFQTS